MIDNNYELLRLETGLSEKVLKEIVYTLKSRSSNSYGRTDLTTMFVVGLDTEQLLLLGKAIAKVYLNSRKLVFHADMKDYSNELDSKILFREREALYYYLPEEIKGLPDILNEVKIKKQLVIIFENIDIGHFNNQHHLVKIIDNQQVSDMHGEIVDFSKSIIIFTPSKSKEDFVLQKVKTNWGFYQVDWSKLKLKSEFIGRINDRSIFSFK